MCVPVTVFKCFSVVTLISIIFTFKGTVFVCHSSAMKLFTMFELLLHISNMLFYSQSRIDTEGGPGIPPPPPPRYFPQTNKTVHTMYGCNKRETQIVSFCLF